MTPFQMMASGALYQAGDPALQARRLAAKDLCHAFNALLPSQEAEGQALLQKLLGSMGEGCVITAPFWCDYGSNITMGRYFFANHNCVILDCAPVTFGDFVFVGPSCGFYTAGHPLDARRRDQGLEAVCRVLVIEGKDAAGPDVQIFRAADRVVDPVFPVVYPGGEVENGLAVRPHAEALQRRELDGQVHGWVLRGLVLGELLGLPLQLRCVLVGQSLIELLLGLSGDGQRVF